MVGFYVLTNLWGLFFLQGMVHGLCSHCRKIAEGWGLIVAFHWSSSQGLRTIEICKHGESVINISILKVLVFVNFCQKMALYKLWEATDFSVLFLKCYYERFRVVFFFFFLLNLADIPANENSHIPEKLELKLQFTLLKCLFLRLLYVEMCF